MNEEQKGEIVLDLQKISKMAPRMSLLKFSLPKGTAISEQFDVANNSARLNTLKSNAEKLLKNMNTSDAAGANNKLEKMKQIMAIANGIATKRKRLNGKETGISLKFNNIQAIVKQGKNVKNKKEGVKTRPKGILKSGVQQAKNEKTVTNGLIKEIEKFGVNTTNLNKKSVRELENQLGTLRGEKARKTAANEVNRQKVVSNLVKKSTNAVIAKGEAEEKNKLIRQITNASSNKINREAYEKKSIQNLKNQLGELQVQRALKRSQQVNINKEAKSKRDQEERRKLILNIPRLERLGGGNRTAPDVLEAKNLENLRNMKKKLEEKQATAKETKAATKLQAARRGFMERLKIIKNLEDNVKKFKTTRLNHIQKRTDILKSLNKYKKPPITSIEMTTVRQYRGDLNQMKKNANAARDMADAETKQKRNEAERVKMKQEEFMKRYISLRKKREAIYINNNVPGMIKFTSDILPSEIKNEANLKRFKYTTVNGEQKILDNTGMNEIKKNIEEAKRAKANEEANRANKAQKVKEEAKRASKAQKVKENAQVVQTELLRTKKRELINKLASKSNVEGRKKNGFPKRIKQADSMNKLETIESEIDKLTKTTSSGYGRTQVSNQLGDWSEKKRVENFGRRIINTGARLTLQFKFKGSGDEWAKLVHENNEKYKIYAIVKPGNTRPTRLVQFSEKEFDKLMNSFKPTKAGFGQQKGRILKANEKNFLRKQ